MTHIYCEIVGNFYTPCFGEFFKNTDHAHIRAVLPEEWQTRYIGALRAGFSPESCKKIVFMLLLGSWQEKIKVMNWKDSDDLKKMRGDRIYCMGARVDLGHKA